MGGGIGEEVPMPANDFVGSKHPMGMSSSLEKLAWIGSPN